MELFVEGHLEKSELVASLEMMKVRVIMEGMEIGRKA